LKCGTLSGLNVFRPCRICIEAGVTIKVTCLQKIGHPGGGDINRNGVSTGLLLRIYNELNDFDMALRYTSVQKDQFLAALPHLFSE